MNKQNLNIVEQNKTETGKTLTKKGEVNMRQDNIRTTEEKINDKVHIFYKSLVSAIVTFVTCLIVCWIIISFNPLSSPETKEATKAIDKEKIFKETISEPYRELVQSNEASKKKCISILSENFNGYEQKINEFVKDLSNFAILYHWTKGDLENYIKEKFYSKVFSPDDLETAVNNVKEQYVSELKENENKFYINFKNNLVKVSDEYPELNIDKDKIDTMIKRVTQSVESNFKKDANIYAIYASLPTIVSPVLGLLVGCVIDSYYPLLLGATGGTTIGSFTLPGFGTVMGAGAGFLGGLVIDWYIDSKYEKDIYLKVSTSLDKLKNDITSEMEEAFTKV
ncbi:MAG TPA: hypothetical protein PLA12_04085 [Candidatus Hydrogenedens sp.]|nr:hypothetical protein [Candidatus Hydrogenedens sp.]